MHIRLTICVLIATLLFCLNRNLFLFFPDSAQNSQLSSFLFFLFLKFSHRKMLVHHLKLLPVLQSLFHLSSLCYVVAHSTACKSTPSDESWPSIPEWNHLNESLSGRLLHPLPPALACHYSVPGSNVSCADIKNSWDSFAFHRDDPVSTAWNNMNNDSCLPTADAPCSGLGHPVYVVNATTADDVKHAINFARKYNVRLNIKASGHDYLKR